MEIIIKNDYDEICTEAQQIILQRWREKNDLVLGLATGRTPLGLYAKLIDSYKKGEISFSKIRTFSLDEYLGLHSHHSQSFALYLDKNLYSQTDLKSENTHNLKGIPDNIDKHCQEYEDQIKRTGGVDIQILGIGKNGHIGFNEPSSSLGSRTRVKTLDEDTLRTNRTFFSGEEESPRFCLTMGIGTILEAKTILLLAYGKEKAEAVARSVEGPVTAMVPASALQLHPDVKIIIDGSAASCLERRDYYRWVYEHKAGAEKYTSQD